MSKFDKLIIKMRANPRDWRIDDLHAIAERLGYVKQFLDLLDEGGFCDE